MEAFAMIKAERLTKDDRLRLIRARFRDLVEEADWPFLPDTADPDMEARQFEAILREEIAELEEQARGTAGG
jgi:hypothetical protein